MADEEKLENTPQDKKSGKLPLILASFLPIVLMLLGFFFVTKFLNPRFIISGTGQNVGTESSKDTIANQSAPTPVPSKSGIIYEFGTVLVNPLGTEGRRYIKVGINLELRSKSLVKSIDKAKPMLQHQFIITLSSKTIDEISSPEGKLALQKELKENFVSVLGLSQEDIHQVYFSEFVVQ